MPDPNTNVRVDETQPSDVPMVSQEAPPPALVVTGTPILAISGETAAEDLQAIYEMDPRELIMPRVKLRAQGICKFLIADEEVESFDAVVLKSKSYNTWFKSMASKFPECFSLDCIRPDPQSEEPQAELCEGCPHSGRGGKCARGIRLFMLLKDGFLPCVMNVPTTSVAGWGTYVSAALLSRGYRPMNVLTHFAAEKYVTRGGFTVSKLKPKLVQLLSSFDKVRIVEYFEKISKKIGDTRIEESDIPDKGYEETAPPVGEGDVPW